MTLLQQHCITPDQGLVKMEREEKLRYLQQLPAWQLNETGELHREFRFGNYYQTMAFVNAVAWIAHQQDHHPDMSVGYNRCHIRYSTHAVGGISINDFICAAHVDQLQSEDA